LQTLQSIIMSLEGETHNFLDPTSNFLLEGSLSCKKVADLKKR